MKDVEWLAKSLDFLFFVGDNTLYKYLSDINNTNVVKKIPDYTNIKNGIGIFASKYSFTVPGKFLSDETKDSLAFGYYTKPLNFANYQGIWKEVQ